ncbi:MLO-like protein 8 [Linum grandiflorum]
MKFVCFSLCLCLAHGGAVSLVMASSQCGPQRELNQTPTWAVAGVCTVIILISILLEKLLHKLGTWFTERHKRALFEALEKVKAELMVLGFISLILTFSQNYILKICIPAEVANSMLPCAAETDHHNTEEEEEEHHRRLLWFQRRVLAGADTATNCKEVMFFIAFLPEVIVGWHCLLLIGSCFMVSRKGAFYLLIRLFFVMHHLYLTKLIGCSLQGDVPLISANGLHQLHILIFFLAVFHVMYSFITMMLGRLKIRGWKEWEKETSSHDYEFSNDPSRFRLTHETSFVRAHTKFWTRIPVFFYIGCFCRQFFRSVTKSDYLTLRNGFITVMVWFVTQVHLAPGSKFNFQQYIKRSLEDDFKLVVGVSPVLWASFVVFLLLNVDGWQALFWASTIPVIIILAVGTELQSILTKMALEITEKHAVVQGMPLVQGSDQYFWFGRPQLVLHLIHFALFQNAFQITYFLWIWYAFGLKSCFHASLELAILKVSIGVGVLLLCSYITLPLYALVTQMGSNMKKAVFDEQTSKALKKWHMAVKKKQAATVKGRKSSVRTLGSSSGDASPLSVDASSTGRNLLSSGSSAHTLHRFKTTGHSTRSHYAYQDDSELSDMETDPLSPTASSSSIHMSLIGKSRRDHLHLQVDDHEEPKGGHIAVPEVVNVATSDSLLDHRHVEDEITRDSNNNTEDFSFVKPAGPLKQP